MKIEQEMEIIKHGVKLKQFFNLKDIDSLKLCKSLRRLENKAHILTTKECNRGLTIENEEEEKEILNKVDKLLNFKKQNIEVFINGDCRGYALKISDKHKEKLEEINFFRDWGGYGIIAPEID